MNQRGQFTFYRSFWEAVRGLPKKDRLPILEAIISYALDGVVPEGLSQSQCAFFLLVKPNLDTARKKAASGKQGGSKAEANDKQGGSKAEANDKQTEREKEIEKEKEIEIEGEEEKEKEKEQTAPNEKALFQVFWEQYPSKIGCEKAREAWEALNPSPCLAKSIMDGLQAWMLSERWQEKGGRFIPRAAKWLTERHWETAPAPQQDKVPKGAIGELGQAELEAIERVMREEENGEI